MNNYQKKIIKDLEREIETNKDAIKYQEKIVKEAPNHIKKFKEQIENLFRLIKEVEAADMLQYSEPEFTFEDDEYDC